MTKKTDIEVVRCLLVSALIGSALVLFWLTFDTIRSYERISDQIEVYLQQSLLVLNATHSSLDGFSDQTLDLMLDKRLDSMKELLTLLIHVVVILFGFVTTFVDNNALVAVFGLILTAGLIGNLFIPILYSNTVIVLTVILFTISWLYFDLNIWAKDPEIEDRV